MLKFIQKKLLFNDQQPNMIDSVRNSPIINEILKFFNLKKSTLLRLNLHIDLAGLLVSLLVLLLTIVFLRNFLKVLRKDVTIENIDEDSFILRINKSYRVCRNKKNTMDVDEIEYEN